MKIPDVNVLLYAQDETSVQHEVARSWLERSLSDSEPTAFVWPVLLGFLRIGTSSAVYPDPLSVTAALELVDEWLDHPCTCTIKPGDQHRFVLRGLIEQAGVAGNLTSDAHLAALAIEHGATIASFDADFHRFAQLRFEYLR